MISDEFIGWIVRISLFVVPTIVIIYLWLLIYWQWFDDIRHTSKGVKELMLRLKVFTGIWIGVVIVGLIMMFLIIRGIDIWNWTERMIGDGDG